MFRKNANRNTFQPLRLYPPAAGDPSIPSYNLRGQNGSPVSLFIRFFVHSWQLVPSARTLARRYHFRNPIVVIARQSSVLILLSRIASSSRFFALQTENFHSHSIPSLAKYRRVHHLFTYGVCEQFDTRRLRTHSSLST